MRSRIDEVVNDIEESIDVAIEKAKGAIMELDDRNIEGAKVELTLMLEGLLELSKELR